MLLFSIFAFSTLYRVATVREVRKIFKVREKSGNFLKSQGKSLILAKSVKSQGTPSFSGLNIANKNYVFCTIFQYIFF